MRQKFSKAVGTSSAARAGGGGGLPLQKTEIVLAIPKAEGILEVVFPHYFLPILSRLESIGHHKI